MTPGLFLSYSTRDREHLDDLLSALHHAGETVWFDEELGGGDVWWQKILERIRGCDVFVFALSDNSLRSKPCLAELNYAQALGKPVLPIQIGPVASMRVTPLASVEAIDFQSPTADTGIRLITAMQRARRHTTALPSPLPDEPPVPFGYLMRAAAVVAAGELKPDQQAELLTELRAAIEDDGDDATTRGDIEAILRRLRDRSDLTAEARSGVADLLARVGDQETPAASVRMGSRKWLVGSAAAVALIAATVAVVIATHKPDPEPTASPVISPAKLDSSLLKPADVAAIMGTSAMEAQPVENTMYGTPADMSDPDCLGTDIVAAAQVYEGSGWSAVRAQRLSESTPEDPDTVLFWVNQSATGFPSPQQASAFVAKSADRWTGCSDRVVRESNDAGPVAWTYGELTRTANVISQLSFQEGGGDWACEHALTSYSNSVLEAVACGHDITDQARRIVAAMVEQART